MLFVKKFKNIDNEKEGIGILTDLIKGAVTSVATMKIDDALFTGIKNAVMFGAKKLNEKNRMIIF